MFLTLYLFVTCLQKLQLAIPHLIRIQFTFLCLSIRGSRNSRLDIRRSNPLPKETPPRMIQERLVHLSRRIKGWQRAMESAVSRTVDNAKSPFLWDQLLTTAFNIWCLPLWIRVVAKNQPPGQLLDDAWIFERCIRARAISLLWSRLTSTTH